MNKIKILIPGFVFVLVILISCDKKVGKVPEPEPLPVEFCDTITYTGHIKVIIDTNCYLKCHNNNLNYKGVILGTYEQVRARGEDGKIQALVIEGRLNGVQKVMPPSGHLPQEQKTLISCWLANGMKR